ncbi:TetR/AcrR family transcriptional regulator (plasmid) [Bradyrhizobium guangxiense]
MGYSQADKAKSRERILDAAAVQIREQGLDGLSIAESHEIGKADARRVLRAF